MKKIIPNRQSLTAYTASGRKTHCTTFYHPIKKKRINRGLGTADPTEAKEICVHLERIVNNPMLWKIKNKRLRVLHERAIEIFFDGKKPPPIDATETIPGHAYQEVQNPKTGYWSRELLDDRFYSEEKEKALRKIVGLEKDNDRLEREVEYWKRDSEISRRAANRHVTATLGEAVAKWERIYPSGRNRKTVAEAKAALKSFIESTTPDILLRDVRAGLIDGWLSSYRNPHTKEEVSAVTKRRVRAYVSTFFTWAFREYDLTENPMQKTGPIPGLARNPENILAIRRYEDLIMLLDSLKPWPYWRAWVAVACLAGPRWSEQVNLKLADVFLSNGYMRIASRASGNHSQDPETESSNQELKGTKTGRERNVPIEKTVLEPILNEYLSTHDKKSEWLFPTTVEELTRKYALPGQWSTSGTFSTSLHPILNKAQARTTKEEGAKAKNLALRALKFGPISPKEAKATATKKGKEVADAIRTASFWKFGPSEWRHCCGTALGHSGFNALEISRILGNSPDIAERHYIAAISVGVRWPFEWRR